MIFLCAAGVVLQFQLPETSRFGVIYMPTQHIILCCNNRSRELMWNQKKLFKQKVCFHVETQEFLKVSTETKLKVLIIGLMTLITRITLITLITLINRILEVVSWYIRRHWSCIFKGRRQAYLRCIRFACCTKVTLCSFQYILRFNNNRNNSYLPEYNR